MEKTSSYNRVVGVNIARSRGAVGTFRRGPVPGLGEY